MPAKSAPAGPPIDADPLFPGRPPRDAVEQFHVEFHRGWTQGRAIGEAYPGFREDSGWVGAGAARRRGPVGRGEGAIRDLYIAAASTAARVHRGLPATGPLDLGIAVAVELDGFFDGLRSLLRPEQCRCKDIVHINVTVEGSEREPGVDVRQTGEPENFAVLLPADNVPNLSSAQGVQSVHVVERRPPAYWAVQSQATTTPTADADPSSGSNGRA